MTLIAASYFGSKNGTIARWISSYFPNHETYVEPFGGLAAVLLNKARSSQEIYSDLYIPAVNFLQMVQKHPIALMNEIHRVNQVSTPKQIVEALIVEQFDTFPGGAPIESAARFFLYCQYSWSGGGTRWSSGLSGEPNLDTSHLWKVSDRLQGVEIRQADAFETIAALPKDSATFIYVDPPYLQSARKSKDSRIKNQSASAPRKQYAHELTDEQHVELARLLKGRSAAISGYDSPLYRELFSGWDVVSKRHQGDVEYLWISPEARDRVPQLSLFGVV